MLLDRIVGLGALLLAVPVGVSAWRFGLGSPLSPGPGFWPFLIALCIAALGVALTLHPDPAFRGLPGGGSRWKSLGIALATLGLFVLLLEPVGYPATMALLLLVQFRGVEGKSWRVSLPASLTAAAISFVLFRFLLHVPLPAGILPLPPGW
jgi:putative tricarboxylic transport membrane protein